MTTTFWNDLLFALEQQNCILVLGSGVSTGHSPEGAERPLSELLAWRLAGLLERENRVVEGNRDNLYQIAEEFVRYKGHIALHREAKTFYEGFGVPNSVQTTLASLPFHLVLNASPDTLFVKALYKADKIPLLVHYKPPGIERSETNKNIGKPDHFHPVVYNMLGAWTEPTSLVLTEGEQLNYLQDVIQHNDAIPNALLEVCKAEKCVFLFIGFDFERWQLRLLLRALKLDGGEQVEHWAVQRPAALQKDTQLFFKDQYGLHFLDMDTPAFVEELVLNYAHKPRSVASPSTNTRLKAVCLYALEDSAYRQEMEKHLSPLHAHQQLDTWSDALIMPGEPMGESIRTAIAEAHLIIVLASSDFVSSERHYVTELGHAMERFRAHKAKVFVVLVRPFVWEDTLLAQFPLLLPQENGVAKPVSAWPQHDSAWAGIVSLILRHVNYLIEDLKSTVSP